MTEIQKSSVPVLRITGLHVDYHTSKGIAKALRDVEFAIESGERVGLVGESGCGKSTLLKAVMGVLPGNGEVSAGRIELLGRNLLEMDTETRRKTRWAEISMITQSALNALNPVRRVSDQIIEAVRAHRPISKADGDAMVCRLFEMVGVSPERAKDYPHQFSGGMRQRAVIAMALALSPQMIVADEPTTALDVIVQDQIFVRLRELQQQNGFALILVTHDLALVAENCQKVMVMYAGTLVEAGPTADIITAPKHPYTIGLINAVSVLGSDKEPISIPGSPPDLLEKMDGCRFAPRCPLATAICRETMPEAVITQTGDASHLVRCHHWQEAENFAARASDPSVWDKAAI